MERRDHAPVASFFVSEPLPTLGHPDDTARGQRPTIALGADAAHHARVRRIEVGERVRVVDGAGGVGAGTLVRATKSQLVVEVARVDTVEPPVPVHLLVPVADRERMLWLAEKCTELAVTSWRPVVWRRSKSVSPRGEGSGFQQKVRARMIAALEQCGGAWLPALYPDAKPEHAIAATPEGARLLLSVAGEPALSVAMRAPVTIAVGPEGGFEDDEVEWLVTAGFVPAALAGSILRFETAGIAALAIVRATLALTEAGAHER